MKILFALTAFASGLGLAQEASSGFDFHGTVSGQATYSPEFERSPRNGSPFAAGVRGVVYPTWKLNSHWSIGGAVQVYSQPYFAEEYARTGYNLAANLLQLHLSYSQFWEHASLVVKAGQLSPAFGSFQARYDDAVNPLIGAPWSYGYYGKGVTLRGLPSAEIDVTYRKLDARLQFSNSSPANPRTLLQKDQYGAWIGGAGYTIMQGFRVGVSGYRGPYVSRDYAHDYPGEALPRSLPGSGIGLEVQWARGAWSSLGEIQRFQMDYRLIPTFISNTGYAEVRRVLNPRWFVATRLSYIRHNYADFHSYELVAGFRPNRLQILKVGYGLEQGRGSAALLPGRVHVQLVTQFQGLSLSRD